MSTNATRLILLTAAMLSVAGSSALAAADSCAIVDLGRRINTREGGKLLDANSDCNEARFSLPLTEGLSITSMEGQIDLTFEFKAPPRPGAPVEAKMSRAAAMVTGRTRANANWLIRQCLAQAAAAWRRDADFDYQIPAELTRLDQQSFRCGRKQEGPGFQITFHFQDASYFRTDK